MNNKLSRNLCNQEHNLSKNFALNCIQFLRLLFIFLLYEWNCLQVYFELMGTVGSTGVIVPAATKKSFRAGAVDTFTYPQMPFVGHPQRLRVFTDGAGFFSGWHLKYDSCCK